MRTTLDIDDDVLTTAKELARRERSSTGSVLSRLAREALLGGGSSRPAAARRRPAVGGFRPFDSRGVVVSNDAVNALRDAEGI